MLEDAYVAGFAVLVVGSMLGSVLVNVARLSDTGCASSGCEGARALLPWLVVAASVLAVLTVARLLGPVFVSPATASWILPTPVDRKQVLRPRLLLATSGSALVVATLTVAGAVLGGLHATTVAVTTVGAAALGVGVVCGATLAQRTGQSWPRVVGWVVGAAVWLALVAVDLHHPLLASPARDVTPVFWTGLAVVLVLMATTGVLALRTVGAVPTSRVTAGGTLIPGLSGALAGLDLSLAYDVVIAHRSRDRGRVRSRRGGFLGIASVSHLDLVRLRRNPAPVVILLAGLAVPAGVVTAGGGRGGVLAAALVAFLAGLPMLAGLRVLARSPSLVRSLPFDTGSVRRAAVAVPGAALLVFGLCSTPILHAGAHGTWTSALFAGVAVAGSGLASGVRWMTGRPPDYNRPLVSTPAGGVPTNLYGSAVRGFDVVLLTTAPMLLTPRPQGALISLALSAGIAWYLLGREA